GWLPLRPAWTLPRPTNRLSGRADRVAERWRTGGFADARHHRHARHVASGPRFPRLRWWPHADRTGQPGSFATAPPPPAHSATREPRVGRLCLSARGASPHTART